MYTLVFNEHNMEAEMLVLTVPERDYEKNGKVYYEATVRLGTGIGRVNSDVSLRQYLNKSIDVRIDFVDGFNSKNLVPRVKEVLAV